MKVTEVRAAYPKWRRLPAGGCVAGAFLADRGAGGDRRGSGAGMPPNRLQEEKEKYVKESRTPLKKPRSTGR